ncbi:MBL fold metallo-hydrolase [Myxococcus sp. K15C18031901]|uniref:MBL fold metallo-hydrolase n=1 Tax=Myxococcus dinghuensis TaxID=2906761 RepID=UPI0020A7A89F|nr:MBL fold metallo-hydrolase [Myxococcus dinghuensis]MCP3100634.1 MBL fold metallo-hydrolase [Myxococcus dinghuensis]
MSPRHPPASPGRLSLLLLVCAPLLGGCLFAGPSHRGPVTAHFDGEKFKNLGDAPRLGVSQLVSAALQEKRGEWRDYEDLPPGRPPPERVGAGTLRVTVINHATVLVQADGVNVLTDPIYSDRASPVSFLGPRRVHPPGIRFEDLPPIDVVVVSHNHYDHMDLPTLRRLEAAHHPRFVVGLGNKALLDAEGFQHVEELDWWQATEVTPDVAVTAVPAQHRSNRGLTDVEETLWAGYVISTRGGPVLFAGDTGFGPHFAMVAERFGPMRLSVLPIGAYRPRILHTVHMGPREALDAHHVLRSSTSVAMHYNTFPMAFDGQDEAKFLLLRLLAREPVRPRFWALGFGEGREVPALAREDVAVRAD